MNHAPAQLDLLKCRNETSAYKTRSEFEEDIVPEVVFVHFDVLRGDARGQCDRWEHRTSNNEIDFAGPEGLDPMKVDNIKPQ